MILHHQSLLQAVQRAGKRSPKRLVKPDLCLYNSTIYKIYQISTEDKADMAKKGGSGVTAVAVHERSAMGTEKVFRSSWEKKFDDGFKGSSVWIVDASSHTKPKAGASATPAVSDWKWPNVMSRTAVVIASSPSVVGKNWGRGRPPRPSAKWSTTWPVAPRRPLTWPGS